MADKGTERYFKLLKKNEELFVSLLKNKASKEDRQKVAFCLTEIYFMSQSLAKLIKKISETNLNFSKDDLDLLLGNLINLRIEIYDKMADGIRDLKRPLNIVIDTTGKLVGDKPSDKSGANVARKIIRSSIKQFDNNLKKIRYYNTRYNTSKKNQALNKRPVRK
ncbi:MAG: hypothetical protein WC454_10120 [Phycisphaerae bacterium]